MKININLEKLKRLYAQGKTQAELAKIFGVHSSVIRRRIVKLGILRKDINVFLRDKDWLIRKYNTERLTIKEIAKEADTSSPAVSYWMDAFNIPRRPHGEVFSERYSGEAAPFFGKKHSAKTRKKIAENHADVSGENNPMYGKAGPLSPNFGKKKSEECRKKLSVAHKGKLRPNITGAKNYNWKGGKTSLIVNLRNCTKMETWRLAVFNRDKFTCQKCGDAKGGNLNSHHIHRLADLIEENGIKTLKAAYACALLWTVDNGLTLCESCHDNLHKKH